MSPTPAHPIPDRHGVNLFTSDPALRELLPLYLPADLVAHLLPHLSRLGALAGGVLDELAHERRPATRRRCSRARAAASDAQRIARSIRPTVELERVAFGEYGLAAMSHRGGVLGWPAPMPPAAKYALSYLFVQAEFGLCCPLSMTDSLARTLRRFGDAGAGRALPAAADRRRTSTTLRQGAMFMTEQGAGSDVAATATRAVRRRRRLAAVPATSGSARTPTPDMAMVLARPDGAPAGMRGVSLFLLPRTARDGTPNAYRDRAAEGQARHALDGQRRDPPRRRARLPGRRARPRLPADGRHGQQLAPVERHARRRADAPRDAREALFVAGERMAFGKRLRDMPLMRRQLLKLMLPTEQARTMMLQTAEALRRADAGDADAYALVRILTPLIKFRACRDARKVTRRRDGSARRLRLHRGMGATRGAARRDAGLASGKAPATSLRSTCCAPSAATTP